MTHLEIIDRSSHDSAWDELATFLRRGFSRNFEASGLRWEFRNGFVAVLRRSGNLVASQGFLPIQLTSGRGSQPSAKSERTLLAPELRGSGAFVELYAAAMDEAERRFGSALLYWGMTAVPRAFERVGFTSHPLGYRHAVLALDWRLARRDLVLMHPRLGTRLGLAGLLIGSLPATYGRPRKTPSVEARPPGLHPSTTEEYIDWQFRDHPSYQYLHCGNDKAKLSFTIDAAGNARLRLLESGPAELISLFKEGLAGLRTIGARTLRVTFAPGAGNAELLDSLCRCFRLPTASGGGCLIALRRDGGTHGLLLADWDLAGWEDVIYEPQGNSLA